MSVFAARVDAFFAELFALDPVRATEAGMHDHDGGWPDVTESGRREWLAFVDGWLSELSGLPDEALEPADRIDRDVLLLELQAMRFGETELRQERWDPLEWVYLLGAGLFSLISREFAPLATRLASASARLEGVPRLLDGARLALGGDGGRPVSRLHTETALKQLPGIVDLADDTVRAAEEGASDPDVAAIVDRVRSAGATAKEALAAFELHLRDTVLPASHGEGRLGLDLFTKQMRHTIRSDELTPERIRAAAEEEFAAVRGEMVRLARESWDAWCNGREMPADEGKLVRAVLDEIALDHPPAADLLDFSRAELGRIEVFCRERGVIGLADEPLDIRWTPAFMRSFGGAMLDAPGPLDKGQKSFFSITPIPEDWSPAEAESYLREMNARQLRVLTIHEAVPGHYLQGVYANRSPSLVRSILWSGLFAEGWAVYVTQVMLDLGYGADDPGLLLTHWKYYLRAVTNAIIDARIHTAGMTEDEAVSLMVEGAFQEEAEARAKYNRARLTSTQLSTYFVGSMEFHSIEREVRRRAAVASGDPEGAEAVPEPRVVGGLGDTPGFNYRTHLEACISHGSPPPSILRRILLD